MAQPHAPTDRFFLWIDAVGGYWICTQDEVTLGQAGGTADLPFLADLSQQHARIRRDGEGYVLEALRETYVDQRPVSRAAWLGDGAVIQLGHGLKLAFRRPHALSATARLEVISRHRTQPSVDAIVLMADTCVLGPQAHSHVVCPEWPEEVILYRQERQLYCRTSGELQVDGVAYRGRARVTPRSRIAGAGFSLALEAMEG